jgi:hypothetical protein
MFVVHNRPEMYSYSDLEGRCLVFDPDVVLFG